MILDGSDVGSLSRGETLEFKTQPGSHTLSLKIDWCRSNEVSFETFEGEAPEFRCGGLTGLKVFVGLWYITFGRNRYLWLKRVDF